MCIRDRSALKDFSIPDIDKNDCYKYAAIRNILHRKGKSTEITVAYEPYMWCFGEWLKQLFGESEGKDGKGLFPASMIYSTDLHSLGQFVQQGTGNMFETVIWIKKAKTCLLYTSSVLLSITSFIPLSPVRAFSTAFLIISSILFSSENCISILLG